MAYTASFSLDIGATGLTLKWALTAAGTIHATLRDQTATFYADAAGGYECLVTTLPDSYRGRIIFYTGTIGAASDFVGVTVKSSASINPSELENTDAKTSSRNATAPDNSSIATILTEVQKVPRSGTTHTHTNTSTAAAASVAIT